MLAELSRFSGLRAKTRAINRAFGAIHGLLAITLFVLLIASVMSFGTYVWAVEPLGLSGTGQALFFIVFVVFTTGLLVLLLVGRFIQQHLRQQIIEGGHPICLHCGYDLQGLAIDLCPECGDAFKRKTRDALAVRVLLWVGLFFAALQIFGVLPLAWHAGTLRWQHAPAVLCWLLLGGHCYRRIRVEGFTTDTEDTEKRRQEG